MIEKVKKYLEKLLKAKKVKSTEEMGGEMEEIVNSDGVMKGSSVPILDPRLHPRKTMDQTVVATTQPGNWLARTYQGGRTYYYESEVKEEDMSGAFGYEETKDLPPKQTVKVLKKMGVDNPVERAKEFGKDPKMDQDKKKRGSEMRIRLQEKEAIEKLQRERMSKMVEDMIFGDKSKKSDIRKKKTKDNEFTRAYDDLIKKLEKKSKESNILDQKNEQ
jgi:protein-tyrosine-phosphatase